MRDETLLYWGMLVTFFSFFAALLTARQLFENYMERREEDLSKTKGSKAAITLMQWAIKRSAALARTPAIRTTPRRPYRRF